MMISSNLTNSHILDLGMVKPAEMWVLKAHPFAR